MARSKDWVFTDFDVSDERRDMLLGLDVVYIVFQKEMCPETGMEHLQGFVQMKNRVRMGGAKDVMGNKVHLEKRRGSVKDAIQYCKKEDTRVEGPWEAGVPTGQGKRKDLENIKTMLDEGKSVDEVADEHFGTWCRNYRAIDRYVQMKRQKRSWAMDNTWYWGDAGTGKTRAVHDAEPDVYVKLGGKWFDQYTDQEAVLIDDFTGDMDLSLFLKILDRYPLNVEVKGGSTSFLAKRIYVTSNLSPEECFPMATREQHAAIRRRFTRIVHYSRGL